MSNFKSRSIAELFERNKRILLDCLTRQVGPDHASDLLQETFVRMLQRKQTEAIVDGDAHLRMTAISLARAFRRTTPARRAVVAQTTLRALEPPG